MKKLSHEKVLEKLYWLGVVNIETDKPLSYVGFKNRTSVIEFYNSDVIVFLGQPKQNMFGFYVDKGHASACTKQAYQMFTDLVSGKMEDFKAGRIQWTKKGMPLEYTKSI